MKKFTAWFKNPCNVQSNSPQAEAYRNATIESRPDIFKLGKIVVMDNGDVWINRPRYYTGVINRRAAGGKWEKVNTVNRPRGISASEYLLNRNAQPVSFKGGPRV